MNKLRDVFVRGAAVLLLITGVAKLVSITGHQGILGSMDPLLPLKNRQLLLISGSLEIILSAFLFMGQNLQQKIAVINWLSVTFLIYHVGINMLGPEAKSHCPCLGNLADRLHISQAHADFIAYIFSAGMFTGSTFLLCFGKITKPAHAALAPG